METTILTSKKLKTTTEKAFLFIVTFDEGQNYNDKGDIVYGYKYVEIWVSKSMVQVQEGKFYNRYTIPTWIIDKAKKERTIFHAYPKSTMRYW